MWYSFGMNQQSFDLGLMHDRWSGMEIPNFIDSIDDNFDLVMITERMEESLVLLADMLCVPLENVAILKNQGPNSIENVWLEFWLVIQKFK